MIDRRAVLLGASTIAAGLALQAPAFAEGTCSAICQIPCRANTTFAQRGQRTDLVHRKALVSQASQQRV